MCSNDRRPDPQLFLTTVPKRRSKVMNECAGDWISFITWTIKDGHPVPHPQKGQDGVVHINPHASSHAFTGEHRPPHAGQPHPLSNTDCSPTSANEFDITFVRRDNSSGHVERFRYTGHGTIDPSTGDGEIEGDVTVIGGGPGDGDTGTWESTRAGGGNVDDVDRKNKKGEDTDDRGHYKR
jgi:hypothetical protein